MGGHGGIRSHGATAGMGRQEATAEAAAEATLRRPRRLLSQRANANARSGMHAIQAARQGCIAVAANNQGMESTWRWPAGGIMITTVSAWIPGTTIWNPIWSWRDIQTSFPPNRWLSLRIEAFPYIIALCCCTQGERRCMACYFG